MDVSSATTATTKSTQSSAASARKLSSDFETFLKMLTAQMKNQDPLKPLDSTEFATQLATFSGVEQQVLTNQHLESLKSSAGFSSLTDVGAILGREVLTSVKANFNGQPLTLVPPDLDTEDPTYLIVRDADGIQVAKTRIDSDGQPLQWAGVAENGTPFASGLYSFTVQTGTGDKVAEKPVPHFAPVVEARLENGQAMAVFAGDQTYPVASIQALR